VYHRPVTLPEYIGRYRVLGLLGQGAMGVVYRGHDDTLEREVALKVMSVGRGADEDARRRFEREGKAAARLQHPNIVTIYELGQHEGAPFMALELLEGVDLQRAIEAGLRPDPKVTLPIVLQLLSGLGHAHDQGIVHRDVKPSNLFLPRGRPAKIMDFGVARLSGGTSTSGMVGTPNYMSPEQVRSEEVDGRSDLFSAGLILFELVTGEKAYRGDTIAALLYKIAHVAPDLRLLPRGPAWERLRGVVTRALCRDAAGRYPDAVSMVADLELALHDLGGASHWAAASDAALMVRTAPRPAAPASTLPATPAPAAAPPPAAMPALAALRSPTRPAVLLAAGLLAASVLLLAVVLWITGGPAGTRTPTALASPSTTVSTGRPATVAISSPASAANAARTSVPPPPPASAGAAVLPAAAPVTPLATPDGPGLPVAAPKPTPAAVSTPAAEVSSEEARLERAEDLFEQGRYGPSLAEARAVLRREPGNLRAKTLVEDAEVELAVETRIREARAALQKGDKDAAIEAIRAGLILKPSDARLLALWKDVTKE
jgi:serine/threonine-protein kinase